MMHNELTLSIIKPDAVAKSVIGQICKFVPFSKFLDESHPNCVVSIPI